MSFRGFLNRAVSAAILSTVLAVGPVLAQGGPPGGGGGGGGPTEPVADAGRDRTVLFDGVNPVTVVLDGTGTIDGDGQQLTDDDPATPYGITWSFVSKPAGSAATLSDDQAIRPSFMLDEPGDYVIQLSANDGTTVSTDTVTISTESSAPGADAGRDRKVALDETVVLDGSGSTDWDGDALTYSWSVTDPADNPVTLSDPNAVMPSFLVEQLGDYTATLTVSDGVHTSEPDEVLVSTVNVPPAAVANAGQDATIPTGLFLNSLDAEGTSDLDGDVLTYRWSLLWGPPGGGFSLDNTTERRAAMSTVNAAGDWVVQLTVDDGTFIRDTTFLLASATNIAPTAIAGADRAVAVGQTVQLDGTGSVDNSRNEIASYRWALIHRPAGSAAALDDSEDPRPRFTVDVAGTYVAQLIVNDGVTDSVPDTVVISTDANLAPVADAGTDHFQQGLNETIQLDGTGSTDPNGDPLTYRWTMLERADRSSAVLSDPASPMPTFVADKTGFYVIQLVVSDGITESAPDIVMVSAKGQGGTADVNLRPIAEGGAAITQSGPALVQLDGSGSVNPNDPNPINLTYRWALIHRPAGSAAQLSDPAAIDPTFATDVAGLYVAQLMVNDGVFWSIADTAVTRLNAPPVADAGPDQSGFVDQLVTLDGGASSDADGDPLSFGWTFAAKPAGSAATLSGATTATPSFTPDVFGDYVVELVVNDGLVDSAPDSVTVSMVNRAPVAEAGAEQTVTAGALVQLDGSASSDPDHQPLTFAWRFTAKPAGSLAALSDPTAVAPTFTADVEGLYVLDLVVNDGIVDSAPDTVGVRAGSGVVNTAPVLDPVGQQSVTLGDSLSFTLTASDADDDPLTFFATSLPLPDGASLDGASGAFTFRPGADQVGVHTITFGASDGLASDSESVQITVSAPPAGTATTLTGQLLDAVSSAAGQTVPVSGATVTLVGSGVSATTDAQGLFSLASVPSGDQLLSVDGATAAPAPDGSSYGSARQDVTLIADAVNTLDGVVYLARIDPDGSAPYASADPNPTTVANAALGVTLTVQPGSATLNGAAFDGTISVSDMPSAEAVAMLPPFVSPCQVIAIEPFGIRFDPLAGLRLANLDGLPAGSVVDIWGLNPDTGLFLLIGAGTVTADGASIDMTSGGVHWGTMVMATPRAPTAVAAIDMNGFNRTPTLLGDGNVTRTITLPAYTSLDQERTRTMVYNSATADPRPVVAAEVTFPANSGMPATLEGRLIVGGAEVAGPVFTSTAGDPLATPPLPPLAAGQPIRQALQVAASDLPTGSYPYRYVASSRFSCSTVGAVAEGNVIIRNETGSGFGAGWTLAEQETLSVRPDGSVVLSEGDGSVGVFETDASGDFFDPVGFPASGPLAGALDDLDGDGNLDMAIPSTGTGNVELLFGDGFGDFPTTRNFNAGAPFGTFGRPDLHTVRTGDFNNDGIRDLAVNNQMSNRMRVYLGTGGGFFAAPRDIPLTRPQGFGVADFNGDGNDDIAVATTSGSRAVVFFGDGSGGFPANREFTLGSDLVAVEIADFDNNGSPDAAVANSFTNRISILLSEGIPLADGTGNFTVATTSVAPIRNAVGRFPMAAADYNGDGNQDIALTVQSQNFVQIYFGNGAGGLVSGVSAPTGFEANSVRSVDYDRDGDMDIVASGRFVSNVAVVSGDGAGGFALTSTVPVASGMIAALLPGDFNHDSVPDLQLSANGVNTIFALIADTGFRSPGADFSTLTKNADGTYVRRMTDGTTVEFNADGLMTARVDANGNRTEYSYDANGLLTEISDPADPTRSTVFDYSGGTLSSVTDVAGRTSFFQVDAEGNLVGFQDAEGNLTRYAYDSDSKLAAFASARGFVTTYDYGFAGQWIGSGFPDGTSISASISGTLGLSDFDSGLGTETNPDTYVLPEDRISTLQDAKGNLYEMEVNEFGALVRVTDPIGRTTRFVRDADNLVRQAIRDNDGLLPDGTAPATVTTLLEYDGRGNVIVQTEAAGTALERTTRFEYEPNFNRTTRIVDPSNGDPAPACGTAGVTCFEYDPTDGNLLRVVDARGGEQVFTYDSRGLRETATDANGNLTTFTYDFLGNVETVTNGAGDVSRMLRDAAGQATGVTEGFGTAAERTTTYVFDDLGRIVSETDPEGGVAETVYDAAGNVIEETDPTGIASTSEYDEMGRLTAESHPATGTVRRTYDENGNLASLIDPTGNIAHFRYDAVNRADRTEDPAQGVRLFAYDLADNPRLVTDANGNATSFTYDVHGREIERANALGNTWTFAYDSRDNMVRTVDAIGQTIDKTYDELNRLTGIELIEADEVTVEDTVTFTYDAQGLKTSATDGDSSLAWSYDAANRVATAETVAAVQPAVVLTHTYDAVGNRTGLTHGPDAATIDGAWSFVHDGNGSLTRVTMPTMESIDLVYDAARRLERVTSANTVESQVLYDALSGRPDRIAHSLGAATLAGFDYGFDVDGKITSIADAGGTRDFTYDATLQLTGGGYASAPESYSYDAEGNRTSSHLSASHVHDIANRLREDDEACYDYDENGNLTSKRVKVGADCTDTSGATTTFTWDVLNRLVRIDKPDGTHAAYRYDAQGRRIGKDVDGVVTRYVYDGPDILLEFDAAGLLAARYSHGEQVDQPLAMTRGGGSYFYHTDHLGSVRLSTDAGGAVVSRYDYDAFGNLEPTSFEGVANPYGFTARERDAESGLMFYRARYYDPETGRFISEDPLGLGAGDLNFYGYVFNSPQNHFDPYGLLIGYAGQSCFSGAGGAAVGGIFGAIVETILNSVVLDIAAPEEQSTSADTLGAAALAAGIAGGGTEFGLSLATCGRIPGGRGGSVKLYRAVSTAELDDIAAFGAFRGAPGQYEGKLFTNSAQNAAEFAKRLHGLDGKAYTIIEASIPKWLADKLYYFDDFNRLPAVGVDRTLLKEFNAWARIKAWNYLPLPG